MQFHEKNYDLLDFTRFFFLYFYKKISGPLWIWQKKKSRFICEYKKKFQARKTTMEDILEDPEAIAQLYLLWTNKISNNSESGRNLVELSQQIDKGYVKEERKPIYR